MGVFARIFGRSKVSEEASSAEAEAGTETAEPAAEAAEPSGPSGAEVEETAPAAAADTEGTGTDDGVEIPKQQSADEAADSETGEGARR
ncbi:hypothetical protein ACFV46_28290 [Streptomyces sp. NPDC059852]|uniref:hypothetical protein n=1 Tax=Streptomyces sp. NPDC059852 TaxID=3346972 RepID=UPI00365CF69A